MRVKLVEYNFHMCIFFWHRFAVLYWVKNLYFLKGKTLHVGFQSPVSHLLQSPTPADRFQSPTLVRRLFVGAGASLPLSSPGGLLTPTQQISNNENAPPSKTTPSLILFFRKVINNNNGQFYSHFSINDNMTKWKYSMIQMLCQKNVKFKGHSSVYHRSRF